MRRYQSICPGCTPAFAREKRLVKTDSLEVLHKSTSNHSIRHKDFLLRIDKEKRLKLIFQKSNTVNTNTGSNFHISEGY